MCQHVTIFIDVGNKHFENLSFVVSLISIIFNINNVLCKNLTCITFLKEIFVHVITCYF